METKREIRPKPNIAKRNELTQNENKINYLKEDNFKKEIVKIQTPKSNIGTNNIQKDNKKSNKKSNRKLFFIVAGFLLGIIIVAGIIVGFSLKDKPLTPSQVKILKNEKTYFSIDSNNNFSGYRFKFESSSDVLTFDSHNNFIILEDDINGLEIGESYEISACYLGENKVEGSNYSMPVTWVYYERLATPSLYYNQITESLSWNKIENADYYKLFVDQGLNGLLEIECVETNFDLSSLNGGEKKIFVYAYSNNPYIEQSYSSNTISVDYVKYFDEIVSAQYSMSTKILTITTTQEITKIDIKVDIIKVEDKIVQKIDSDEYFVYQILLENFEISQDSVIFVSPSTIDENNLFDGEPTQVEIIV